MGTVGTLDEIRRAWPQWRIEHRGDEMIGGYVYVGRPVDEETQPPVWEHHQLLRGLKSRVVHEDIREFERQIALQDKLRRQMADEGETPYDGRTYVEVERDRAELSDA